MSSERQQHRQAGKQEAAAGNRTTGLLQGRGKHSVHHCETGAQPALISSNHVADRGLLQERLDAFQ